MKNLVMVVTHKPCDIVSTSPYQPIIVGKGGFELPNALRDNVDDNIAAKNPYYCELTALYWVWKNRAENFDSIGLCHYRRFFTKKALSNAHSDLLTDQDIDRTLHNYDVILATPFVWPTSLDQIYFNFGQGKEKDLCLTREAIENLFPEYLTDFDQTMKCRKASYCNMFIMKKERCMDYCNWLFSVLQYVEDHIDMTGYTPQQQRVFGYLSELLLNVWVRHHKLKKKYYPIAYMELSKQEQREKVIAEGLSSLKLTIRNLIK